MSSRIQFDQPDLTPNEEPAEAVFYDDGTIRVTQKMIVFGAPHNQAFAVREFNFIHLWFDVVPFEIA